MTLQYIEEVDLERSDDGYDRLILVIEGDFVATFENYLENEKLNHIKLGITRPDAEKLFRQIAGMLGT